MTIIPPPGEETKMTKIDAVNTAMAQAPYFALSPQQISALRADTTPKPDVTSAT